MLVPALRWTAPEPSIHELWEQSEYARLRAEKDHELWTAMYDMWEKVLWRPPKGSAAYSTVYYEGIPVHYWPKLTT